MSFKDELEAARNDILARGFDVRDGQVVPTSANVGFNQAVKITATYLYADMVGSSGLTNFCPKETAGKVFRVYLDLVVRIMRRNGGHIRSFDGDRVMAIFKSDSSADAAVKSAMQIKWACMELIEPALKQKYKSLRDSDWSLRAGCGISKAETFLVRGGVRRSGSDLVSIGLAPNLAAKLSDIRDSQYHIRIGAGTYKDLNSEGRESAGANMWQGTYSLKLGKKSYPYYRSSYHWKIS